MGRSVRVSNVCVRVLMELNMKIFLPSIKNIDGLQLDIFGLNYKCYIGVFIKGL